MLDAGAAIDPEAREVCTTGGMRLAFDTAPIDTVGVGRVAMVQEDNPCIIDVRPISGLVARTTALPTGARVVVAGGGVGALNWRSPSHIALPRLRARHW